VANGTEQLPGRASAALQWATLTFKRWALAAFVPPADLRSCATCTGHERGRSRPLGTTARPAPAPQASLQPPKRRRFLRKNGSPAVHGDHQANQLPPASLPQSFPMAGFFFCLRCSRRLPPSRPSVGPGAHRPSRTSRRPSRPDALPNRRKKKKTRGSRLLSIHSFLRARKKNPVGR